MTDGGSSSSSVPPCISDAIRAWPALLGCATAVATAAATVTVDTTVTLSASLATTVRGLRRRDGAGVASVASDGRSASAIAVPASLACLRPRRGTLEATSAVSTVATVAAVAARCRFFAEWGEETRGLSGFRVAIRGARMSFAWRAPSIALRRADPRTLPDGADCVACTVAADVSVVAPFRVAVMTGEAAAVRPFVRRRCNSAAGFGTSAVARDGLPAASWTSPRIRRAGMVAPRAALHDRTRSLAAGGRASDDDDGAHVCVRACRRRRSAPRHPSTASAHRSSPDDRARSVRPPAPIRRRRAAGSMKRRGRAIRAAWPCRWALDHGDRPHAAVTAQADDGHLVGRRQQQQLLLPLVVRWMACGVAGRRHRPPL